MGSVMNGWDLIAAARQRVLNKALDDVGSIYHVEKTYKLEILKIPITADAKIDIKAPNIKVRPGGGTKVDVIFPMSGQIAVEGLFTKNFDNASAIVTTDLLMVESDLQPENDNTYYDFILNLKEGFIVDFKTKGTPKELEILVGIVKNMLKDLSDNKTYKLATIKMPKELKEHKALVPHLAKYSFIEDPKDINNSVLAILMLSNSTKEGSMTIDNLLLPDGSDSGLLISNDIFMNQIVKPALIDGLKEKAKDKSEVASKISTKIEKGLNVIYNTGDIKVKEKHNPWISDLESKIDNGQFYAYLKVKANVTFMDIHISTWVKDWYEFYIEDDEIKMKQTKEEKDKHTSVEWWKWLIAAVLGPLYLIIFAIIVAAISTHVPSLGGSFADIAKQTVQWPNQKYVKLSDVTSPGDIIISTELGF
ncbi:hypothetical protein HNP86_001332 [Methanococcus maripaludis]|uniref:Uncharacterized protein n=1 Tax=Methanococcus maripaludis TaxID=39152 RepID=A0A7J9NV77_METMI|nr:TULIP family P47-like protein [Methanococcus maripaludis]MBA2851201.1 hypothetical protein [Methanococcus maripaludis]